MAESPIFEFADRFIVRTVGARSMPRDRLAASPATTIYSPTTRRTGSAARADHMRRAAGRARGHRHRPTTTIGSPRTSSPSDSRRRCSRTNPASGSGTLRAIAAPLDRLRSTFDLMPREGDDAWQQHRRLASHAIPAALDGLRATYDDGRADGVVAARRQACGRRPVRDVGRRIAGSTRWRPKQLCATMCRPRCATSSSRVPTWPTLRTAISPGTCATTTLPDADPVDGCGAERYTGRRSRRCWAPTSIRRRCTSGRGPTSTTCAPRSPRPASASSPGAGFAEVIDLLDTDPDRADAQRRRVSRRGCRRSPTKR